VALILLAACTDQGFSTLSDDVEGADEPPGEEPPVVEILTPPDGSVLQEGAEIAFEGLVSDPDSQRLHARWMSNLDGELDPWTVTEDRSAFVGTLSRGVHHLVLAAQDGQGHRTTDGSRVEVCGWVDPEDFTQPDDRWTLEGSAHFDGDDLELTGLAPHAAGSAFQTLHAVDTRDLGVTFRAWIGDGDGADGFSLSVVRPESSLLGAAGGCLGYGDGDGCTPDGGEAMLGFHLEFDTFENSWDPTAEPHVAVHVDGEPREALAWAELPGLRGGWFDVRLELAAPLISVWVDDELVLDGKIAELVRFDGWLGFTAGTGDAFDLHTIDRVEVAPVCE